MVHGVILVILALGAVDALIPFIIILILVAAAAGFSRGSKLFGIFGVGALMSLTSRGGGGLTKRGSSGRGLAKTSKAMAKSFSPKKLAPLISASKAGKLVKKGYKKVNPKRLISNLKKKKADTKLGVAAIKGTSPDKGPRQVLSAQNQEALLNQLKKAGIPEKDAKDLIARFMAGDKLASIPKGIAIPAGIAGIAGSAAGTEVAVPTKMAGMSTSTMAVLKGVGVKGQRKVAIPSELAERITMPGPSSAAKTSKLQTKNDVALAEQIKVLSIYSEKIKSLREAREKLERENAGTTTYKDKSNKELLFAKIPGSSIPERISNKIKNQENARSRDIVILEAQEKALQEKMTQRLFEKIGTSKEFEFAKWQQTQSKVYADNKTLIKETEKSLNAEKAKGAGANAAEVSRLTSQLDAAKTSLKNFESNLEKNYNAKRAETEGTSIRARVKGTLSDAKESLSNPITAVASLFSGTASMARDAAAHRDSNELNKLIKEQNKTKEELKDLNTNIENLKNDKGMPDELKAKQLSELNTRSKDLSDKITANTVKAAELAGKINERSMDVIDKQEKLAKPPVTSWESYESYSEKNIAKMETNAARGKERVYPAFKSGLKNWASDMTKVVLLSGDDRDKFKEDKQKKFEEREKLDTEEKNVELNQSRIGGALKYGPSKRRVMRNARYFGIKKKKSASPSPETSETSESSEESESVEG